ncbi:MAG: SH3 domain-containing protein [Ardenticatenaceae bacterium]|nr:SH3 domain-containing protein [Ardenticatenaceae bacterium]
MFQRFQLRGLAKQEYEQARGTAHKQLLHTAVNLLRQEMKRLSSSISSARRQKDDVNQSYYQALETALVQIIVHERLQDVPGIGAQRKAQILQHVFRGHLSDLSHAYQLQGVGHQTQQALDAWVTSYQRQLPTLLESNFVGRAKIDQKYQPEIEKADQQLAKLEQQQRALETKIARIANELKWLDAITEKDFYNALKNPEHPTPNLNLYVQGVFGEWESMPDWFRQAIDSVESIPTSSPKPEVSPKPKLFRAEKAESQSRSGKVRKWLIGGCLITSGVALFCFVFTLLLVFLTPDAAIEDLSSPTAMPPTVVITAPPPTPSATSLSLPTETAVATATATPLPTVTATSVPVSLSLVRIVADAANLREGPGTNFAVIDTLFENERLELLEQTGDGFWYQVRLEDGSTGWIGSSVAEIVQSNPLENDE